MTAPNHLFNTKGSLVALVTPMLADGQIDWPCYRKLVDWHVEQGTHGIVAVGTTGESPTVSRGYWFKLDRRSGSIDERRSESGRGSDTTSGALL
jgi:hypothetical protein